MNKVWVFLLVTSPFLGFYAWAGWWLVTDALRERQRMLAAVRDDVVCRSPAQSLDEAA